MLHRFVRSALYAPVLFALAASLVCCSSGASTPFSSATPFGAGITTATTASGQSVFACSWSALSNANELNIAYPDANATYWVQPLSLHSGDFLLIGGAFPGARYFSFTTYNTDGSVYSQSPPTEIDDAQLGALSGTNYYASAAAAPLPPTGTYQFAVRAGAPSLTTGAGPGSVAVLAAPLSQSGLSGWLLYRVYAPYVGAPGTSGTPQNDLYIQGGVPLPSISVTSNGSNVPAALPTLSPCNSRAAEPVLTAISVVALNSIVSQAATPAPEPLFQYNNGGSLFPNADNKYVYGTTTWAPGRLILVTGATPTFPNTNVQAIVQSPVTNVRYWSFCTNKAITPAPVVACADDQNTVVFAPSPGSTIPPATSELFPAAIQPAAPAASSQYVYLISSLADRPANLDKNITWLPWLLRSMSPRVPVHSFRAYSSCATSFRHQRSLRQFKMSRSSVNRRPPRFWRRSPHLRIRASQATRTFKLWQRWAHITHARSIVIARSSQTRTRLISV